MKDKNKGITLISFIFIIIAIILIITIIFSSTYLKKLYINQYL